MKTSLKYAFVLLLLLVAIPAHAQTSPSSTESGKSYENPYGFHICGDEKAAVTKACKKGDPCGKPCQAAERKLKKCSIANNLPEHKAGGNFQKPDCTKPEDLPGAPVESTPTQGNPVNPLQSNHF